MKRWTPILAWALVVPALALAHENPRPSATLVQRDGGHLTLTVHLDLARALHRTLQPKAAPLESLATLAALDATRFATLWEQATRSWSQDCTVVRAGRSVPAERWTWPTARDAQAHLQQQLMPQLTGGHADPERLSVQAEFRMTSEPIGRVQLRLPAALRPLSVTTLRPRHHWAADGDAPLDLTLP